MTAGKYDITVDQGASWAITLTLKHPNKLPVNLTGYTGIGMIKKSIDDATAIASFAVSFPEPEEGKIVLSLDASQTSLFDFNWGVYDVKIMSPDTVSQVTRILQGKVILNKEVSREVEVTPVE